MSKKTFLWNDFPGPKRLYSTKYTCSMETVQQNGRFTLVSSKFHSMYYIFSLSITSLYHVYILWYYLGGSGAGAAGTTEYLQERGSYSAYLYLVKLLYIYVYTAGPTGWHF